MHLKDSHCKMTLKAAFEVFQQYFDINRSKKTVSRPVSQVAQEMRVRGLGREKSLSSSGSYWAEHFLMKYFMLLLIPDRFPWVLVFCFPLTHCFVLNMFKVFCCSLFSAVNFAGSGF